MSVVIVGGNECMVRQYKELCSEYRCKAKIYPNRLHFQNPGIGTHGNAIHAFECVLKMGLRYMEPTVMGVPILCRVTCPLR